MLKLYVLLGWAVLSVFTGVAQSVPKPTDRQLAWQQMETTAFLHFTVNTYTDKEWGDGTESPQIFNPVNFNADKLVGILKETGFKLVIITAKHHDGFCLWPSKVTSHSVASSPWQAGKGDVVKDIAAACKKHGLKFGFYLSPWDQHEPTYGTAQYNNFYKAQLRELLTHYGEVSEVWFDGAKGKNAKNMEYDFKGYWELVRQLQPGAVMFSDAGPDVRWVGNEAGNAGETCWSTIDTTGMAPGKADSKYLNTGDPNGKLWIPAETDVSIRPGWFYHAAEDSKVKTGKQLVNLYYQSVGRNSLLLLNIPPNRQGLFAEPDIASLREFRDILNETFKDNLLAGQKNNKSLTDTKLNTFISLPVGKPVVFTLPQPTTFDRALFQENIAAGQHNETALLEYWDGKTWQKINEFTTIGYKRLLRFPAVQTNKIRLTVVKAKAPVQLAEIGLFKASARE